MQATIRPKGLAKIWREVKRPFLQITEGAIRRYRYFNPVSLKLPFYSPTDFSPEDILRELEPLKTFSFLPNYGNMGDIVIAMAEYQFFKKHRLQYDIFQNHAFQENLVYGGGGLFVRNWSKCYQWILKLFQDERLKRIVLLPSSFYDCPDLLDVIDERFTIFCREEKSRDYLLSSGIKAKVLLAHDMALFLSKDFRKNRHSFRPEHKAVWQRVMTSASKLIPQGGFTVAWFIRSDSEAKTDWAAIGAQSTLDLSICTNSDSRNAEDVSFYGKLFLSGIDMTDIVVTDRLHVGIVAMLLGKEVFLLDNSYGKVSGVYKRSMKQCPRVHFVDAVSDLPGIIEQTIAAGMVRHTASLENLKKIGRVVP